ncbi:hypothetical protein PCC7805_02186 [Planktothrix agardhii]|jgi:hypothetical protein|uniref:Glycine zipper domain-containing protein n=1 Tax=Planktothrix agardhii TaxID=1160 RepID=A0A1J1JFH6_PLAAG|nr:hypothetical protein [Planktothrix agardhii]CAD5944994.1 hypothetical protein PCC7805_02186 [Planktothrix agardhii]CUM60131.1 conserved protein of unknown function [Planktothrix agardhii]
MESNDIDIVAAGALVGGLGGLLVGGLGGALVGAAGGALAGAKFKQLKEEQSQQLTHREESRKFDPNPPGSDTSTVQPLPSPTPPVKIITKQFLVLVVSHLQADFLESLKAKRRIDFKDGESLYEITKYLWLGDESKYFKIKDNLSQYSVSKGQESEYDICLVYLELNQADEGFKPNVNQLNRFDAFRKLADLSVNLTISPRLQMEAYENIGVYNR